MPRGPGTKGRDATGSITTTAAKVRQVKKVKKVAQKAVGRVRRRGGYISTKGERGTGLKFKLETFATVASFTPGSYIKYGPNPKRPGSLSFARYAGYCKAKTVGEALKMGSKSADLMWELERGDYRVLGGSRSGALEVASIGRPAFDRAAKVLSSFSGPNGSPLKFSRPGAAEELAKEEQWRLARLQRVEQRARELGLKVETTKEIEATTESADIRLQRRVAEALAEQKLKAGRKLTAADAEEVLGHWGFTENIARLNVMPEGQKYVYSDTVGAIRARSFGFGSTPPTKRYPVVCKFLCRWLADNAPKLPSQFVCTAINLNCNYAGRRHRDGNNEGPSVIRAFGKFKGGRLIYFPKDTKKNPRPSLDTLSKKDSMTVDLAKTTFLFNGNSAHEVEPFEGERYSVVFFAASGWHRGKPKDVEFLKKRCGFPFPTASLLTKLKKGCLKQGFT